MRFYDDLIDESFLLLREQEQILSLNRSLNTQVCDSLSLYGGWRIPTTSTVHYIISTEPVLFVPDTISLVVNSILHTMLSYQSLTTYDPILDESGHAITDFLGDPVTSLSFLTDVQLIISYGITVANAINELISTSPELVLPDLLMSDGINLIPTDSPLLSRISALLINNAAQLQPTDQAYIARALLTTISNALNEQIIDHITNITFEYPVIPSNSLQEQITDAITASVAHGLITGNTLNELTDDTAYLLRNIAALLNDSLQILSSDSISTKIVANLLADNALNRIQQPEILVHAVYALLLNSITQNIVDTGATGFGESLLAMQDAISRLVDISPTLTAIFSLLANDSQNLLVTDDAYIARNIMTTLANSLQELDSENVHFSRAFILAIQNALQTHVAGSPRITLESLTTLVREVLARGYYFFKARTKTRR